MENIGRALSLETHHYQCKHTTNNAPAVAAPPEDTLLPLWLSQREVDAIIQLCGASTAYVGNAEDTLFPKLGDLYRAFQR